MGAGQGAGAGQGSGDGRTPGGLAPPECRGRIEGRASVRLGAVPAVPPAAGPMGPLAAGAPQALQARRDGVLRRVRPSRHQPGGRIGAGRSRSASKRPSRRSGWTATRCAAGMAGTGTSPCRCWRWPSWRRCGSTSPAKRGRGIWRIHCLQHARDPPPHRPLPAELCIDFILAWSLWRRLHQAVAKACHWKRQTAKLLIYQQAQL